MKKKRDDFYFKNLETCVGYSHEAASFLKKTMENYHQKDLKKQMEQMHACEQQADAKKHKMMTALSQAFITPIEREDLMALSNYLDDITDAVEEVLLQLYICDIEKMREDAVLMAALLPKAVKALEAVIGELKDFKHSKKMEALIIRVNELEEQGDQLYLKSLHKLYREKDVLTILKWREIYEGLEKCMDTCEHAADIVSTIVMKNT